MANKSNYLALLQRSIQDNHQCSAVHRETVPVHETISGQTIWKGDVEVFDLNGHANANKCYAWSYDENGNGVRFVTILEKHPITSPAMAVKSAIFFDVQPAQYPHLHS
jgi:hypothetical protein